MLLDNLSQARADKVMQRELHMNHCFDILLQALQCSGNLDMIPLVWMYTQEYPFADMYVTFLHVAVACSVKEEVTHGALQVH